MVSSRIQVNKTVMIRLLQGGSHGSDSESPFKTLQRQEDTSSAEGKEVAMTAGTQSVKYLECRDKSHEVSRDFMDTLHHQNPLNRERGEHVARTGMTL